MEPNAVPVERISPALAAKKPQSCNLCLHHVCAHHNDLMIPSIPQAFTMKLKVWFFSHTTVTSPFTHVVRFTRMHCRLSTAVCSGVPSRQVRNQHGSGFEGAVRGPDPQPGYLLWPLPWGRPCYPRLVSIGCVMLCCGCQPSQYNGDSMWWHHSLLCLSSICILLSHSLV